MRKDNIMSFLKLTDKTNKPLLYLAGPLFSEAERSFNIKLKRLLEPFFKVYLPQEDGGLMTEMVANGMIPEQAAKRVFSLDILVLDACNYFLIILDGRSVDEGAAFELGHAYASGKPCYGLKTDCRQLLSIGNNPMIDCSLKMIFPDIPSLLNWAKEITTCSLDMIDSQSK